MKQAVVRILPDGTRDRTAAFTRLISHYVFKDRYGAARDPGIYDKAGSARSRRTRIASAPRSAM
jgi:hypothetical protein